LVVVGAQGVVMSGGVRGRRVKVVQRFLTRKDGTQAQLLCSTLFGFQLAGLLLNVARSFQRTRDWVWRGIADVGSITISRYAAVYCVKLSTTCIGLISCGVTRP
jgi:hypothetical protein